MNKQTKKIVIGAVSAVATFALLFGVLGIISYATSDTNDKFSLLMFPAYVSDIFEDKSKSSDNEKATSYVTELYHKQVSTADGVSNDTSEGISFGYITNGEKNAYGFYTDKLKPNTKYRISWNVSGLAINDKLDFCHDTNIGYHIKFSVNYVFGDGFNNLMTLSHDEGGCTYLYSNSHEFTSGAEGSTFAMFFLESEVVSADEANALGVHLRDNLSFTIYRVE